MSHRLLRSTLPLMSPRQDVEIPLPMRILLIHGRLEV